MKKGGIYNAQLSEAIGRMGHGDIILIGEVKVFVRTGERCPHCYIMLVAGVDF